MKQLFILFITIWTLNTNAQSLYIELNDLDNNPTEVNELLGENYTVFDFWATWCKPCLIALPKLNKIANEFENQGVQFVGINIDGPRNSSKVKPFSASMGITYPILLDHDKEFMNEMNASVMPTLIIVDKKGKEVYRHEGFKMGDEIEIRNKLKELIAL